jgi:hypothetical protein
LYNLALSTRPGLKVCDLLCYKAVLQMNVHCVRVLVVVFAFVGMTLSVRRQVQAADKPRVFVLTDIENEPDDAMSMVRFLVTPTILTPKVWRPLLRFISAIVSLQTAFALL